MAFSAQHFPSDQIPHSLRLSGNNQANWLFFSFHSIVGIRQKLYHYPEQSDRTGVSASLVWSGETLNTPTTFYTSWPHTNGLGFVLNPCYIDEVQQGDLVAFKSNSVLVPEIEKAPGSIKHGYERPDYTIKNDKFTTNIAKYQIMEEKRLKDGKVIPRNDKYNNQGKTLNYALNVLRKRLKNRDNSNKVDKDKYIAKEFHIHGKVLNNVPRFNETITYHDKNRKNPIDGLLITRDLTSEEAQAFIDIYTQKPDLKLYFYHLKAKKHIVRFMEHDDALTFLEQFQDNHHNENDPIFKMGFKQATPFNGFPEYNIKNAIEGISSYQQNASNAVSGFSQFLRFFDPTRGKKRAEIYLTILQDESIPLFVKEIAIYALLQSKDGETLQNFVADRFNLNRKQALLMFKERISEQIHTNQLNANEINGVVENLMRFANSNASLVKDLHSNKMVVNKSKIKEILLPLYNPLAANILKNDAKNADKKRRQIEVAKHSGIKRM